MLTPAAFVLYRLLLRKQALRACFRNNNLHSWRDFARPAGQVCRGKRPCAPVFATTIYTPGAISPGQQGRFAGEKGPARLFSQQQSTFLARFRPASRAGLLGKKALRACFRNNNLHTGSTKPRPAYKLLYGKRRYAPFPIQQFI